MRGVPTEGRFGYLVRFQPLERLVTAIRHTGYPGCTALLPSQDMRITLTAVRLRIATALVAAATLASFAAVLAPTSQAADNGAWSATPTQQGDFTPRQFFFFEASDGQTIKDSITIENAGDAPLPLSVYPADAFNVEAGAAFALRSQESIQNDGNNDVGSWITVSKSQVTVPPRGSVDVPFTMTIPKGVTPGDHAGGIVTLEPEPQPVGDTSQVLNRRALGVRTYVRVAGPLTPAVQVERVVLSVTADRLPFVGKEGTAVITYTVVNTGNVRLQAERRIILEGLFGRTLKDTGTGPMAEILPGSKVTLTETLTGMPVLNQVTARLEVSDPQVGVASAGDDTQWSISITFLIVLVILLVLLIFGLRQLIRRRENRRQAALGESAGVAAVDSGVAGDGVSGDGGAAASS